MSKAFAYQQRLNGNTPLGVVAKMKNGRGQILKVACRTIVTITKMAAVPIAMSIQHPSVRLDQIVKAYMI